MATPNEISSRIVTALSISEPELDAGVGTPLRKIIDTVSEAIAEVSVDGFLTTYQYDIDTRTGADLDAFAAMFGFYRKAASKAAGTILLQRTTPAPESILIGSGSQASTSGSPPVIVTTLVPSVFPRSAVVLEVPVESVDGGSRGNVAAGSVNRWLTSIEGITSITNPAPLVGGSDVETDEQFRSRLKKTIFRNLAGTKDMYTAIGMAEPATSSCKIFGAYDRWTERIEIIGGTGSPSLARSIRNRTLTILTATNASPSRIGLTVPHSYNIGDYVFISGATGNTAINGLRRIRYSDDFYGFYLEDIYGTAINGNGVYGASSGSIRLLNRMSSAYPASYAFGRDIEFNDIFSPMLYTVDFTVFPPVITINDATTIPDGIYEFSFMYTSQASRNYPNRTTNIVADRVDVWIDGTTVDTADVVVVLDSANTLDKQSTLWPSGAYRRRDGQRANPTNSATFPLILPLPLGPIETVPSTISMGNAVYVLGTHYFIVDRIDHLSIGSMEATSGLEFLPVALQAGGVPITITISSTTNATPVVVTTSATHNFSVGQRIRIAGAGVAALNKDWYISAVTSNTLTLQGSTLPGSAGGAAGTVRLYHPVSLEYTFNKAPMSVQRNVEDWRLASSNVLVHKASELPVKFNVAVILKPGNTVTTLQSTVNFVVSEVLKGVGIGGVVQISDVLAAISGVTGVDAVRMLSGSDFTTKTITGAVTHALGTNVATSAAHGFVANQLVDIQGVAGTVEINGDSRVALVVDSTHFVVDIPFVNVYSGSGATVRSGEFATHVMSPDGTRPLYFVVDRTSTPPRPTDLYANDTEHFILHSVVMTQRAQNSWI
jgi:Baseplate J-like protein